MRHPEQGDLRLSSAALGVERKVGRRFQHDLAKRRTATNRRGSAFLVVLAVDARRWRHGRWPDFRPGFWVETVRNALGYHTTSIGSTLRSSSAWDQLGNEPYV